MGSAQSMDLNESDPWWPQPSAQCRSQTVSDDNTARGTKSLFSTKVSENGKAWRYREQELCQTIQHLAEENMRLASSKREMENKLIQAEAVRAEDCDIIAKLRNNITTLTEEHKKLGMGFEEGRIQMSEKAVQKEMEDDLLTQQVNMLLLQKDENMKKIENLRIELDLKCAALETIQIQLMHEKEVGKALAMEIEKLKLELKNISTSNVNGSLNSTEQPPETAHVLNSDDVQLHECADRQTNSERNGRVAEEIEKFKAEMSRKREARHRAMMAISSEMERLRIELSTERESNKQMVEELGRIHTEKKCNHDGIEELSKSLDNEKSKNIQLMKRNECLSSELDNSKQLLTEKMGELEELRKHCDVEKQKYEKTISSLKEVVSISKQMLCIREKQVDDLNFKFNHVQSLISNTSKTTEEQVNTVGSHMATELRHEYQTQLENVKHLKALYQEKMTIVSQEKEKLLTENEEIHKKLEAEQKKSTELEVVANNLKLSLSKQEDIMSSLQTQLDTAKDEAHDLAGELALINNLFTQMLVSNNGSDIDLDKLTKSLQENHDLISEITLKEDGSEIAACLPKLLLELVAEVDKSAQNNSESQTENNGQETIECNDKELKQRPCTACQENNISDECSHNIAAEDIALNLPKVWKVLMELLSHRVTPTERPSNNNDDCCYKKVDTPYGPRLAISVSKTFLRLKDLILEKKSLKKELVQLKQLNCHLESRLSEQEQRLSLVSSELHKTWSVVGRMKTQHQQLHNHEKILRYELQQKRKLLTELKQELEYCRETWEMARAKNSQSEAQWHMLRKEFASRKKTSNSSLDNSGESGFSDDKEDDSGGEDNPTSNTRKRAMTTCYVPEPSELPPGYVPPDLSNIGSQNHSEPGPSVISMQHQVSQMLPPLAVDVTHEQFLVEEVCPLKSPPTPEFLESSACVTVHDGESAVDTAIEVECPVEKYCGLECSTISLISLLKQQLSCFSKNLEEITSDFNGDNHQALQSIFFLPDIKVPYYEQRSDISKVKCANCSKEIMANDVESSRISSGASVKKKCDLFSSNESNESTDSTENESHSWPSTRSIDTAQVSINNEEFPAENEYKKGSDGCTLIAVESKTEEAAKDLKTGNNSHEKILVDRLGRTPEQVLQAREARLKRLEEQCQQLVKKVTNTSNRSVVLSSRLEELHEQYGELPEHTIPEPPPCPDTLPVFRIPVTSDLHNIPPPSPPLSHAVGDAPVLRNSSECSQQATMQTESSSQSENVEDTLFPPPNM